MRLFVLQFLAAAAIATASPAQPPNILIILADDLGQRDLGCYSHGNYYETPHLDRLAAEGVRFTDAYAANPVCSPTRYSVLTGKWPTRARITNWLPGNRTERFAGAPLAANMELSEVTLAEVLKSRGYQAAFVGKWHLGEDAAHWPEHQGFDVNIGGTNVGHPPSWFSPFGNKRISDGEAGEYLTDRLTRETIALLRQYRKSGQPFLLCHFFYQVHVPLEAPAALVEKYQQKQERLGLKADFGTEVQYLESDSEPRRVRLNQTHPVYAAMVESMDVAVGRILAALDDLGLADNTLVIFTSDNGGLSTAEGMPTSNLPFRGGKGWVYEGGIREPFMMRWPGVTQAGAVCNVPVTTVDIFPTVMAAAGVAPEETPANDGENLASLLAGTARDARDLFWHYPHYSNQGGFPGGAIRSGSWKLVEDYEDGSIALFDLAEDPGEMRDQAAAFPERVTELRARLHAWYKRTDAQFLQAKPGGAEPWSPGR